MPKIKKASSYTDHNKKRKNQNRIAAKNSRLKKIKDKEELTQVFEAVKAENAILKAEIETIQDEKEILKEENSKLRSEEEPIPSSARAYLGRVS